MERPISIARLTKLEVSRRNLRDRTVNGYQYMLCIYDSKKKAPTGQPTPVSAQCIAKAVTDGMSLLAAALEESPDVFERARAI